MRTLSGEALLLEVFDLQERDRIVTFLTRGWGKKRGVARGARRRYSRFAGQLQPLAKVELTWFERDDRDLVRIQSVELVRPAHRIQQDLEGILLGFYLAEHLVVFASENQADEPLYRLLDSTLEALLEGVDRSLAARYFEVWVLRLAGVFPPPRECPLCGASFSRGEAVLPPGGEGLVCPSCAQGSGLRVGAAELELLRRIGRENIGAVAASPPPPAVLDRVEGLCAQVRRRFLQHELKSYRVLQQALYAK